MADDALTGMRVLDLTQVMAGPYCTMVLADLGADVIKLEVPGVGDSTRRSWGRPAPGLDSPAFYALNRNKRSIEVDLRSPQGQQQFRNLVAEVDVVVENFRPGVTLRLGVDYETVKKINPAIVYASISGFGQYGPYSQRPGYDLIAQGMAGAISITGEPAGDPVKCGLPVGDLGAGLFCAIGILAAYAHRQRTGEGQYVETSLYEAVLAMSVWESTEYFATGRAPQRLGSANRMTAPYQVLRTGDGHLTVAANSQKSWELLCAVIDRPELMTDVRFVSNADRMDHRAELATELERTFTRADTDNWVEKLLSAGLPCGPILDYQQILDGDPHAAARGMVQRIEHPTAGLLRVLGSPLKLSGTPVRARMPPPLLGAHTVEVLDALTSSTAAALADG